MFQTKQRHHVIRSREGCVEPWGKAQVEDCVEVGGFLDLLSLILVIKGEILPEREGLRGEETETEETDFGRGQG